MRNDDITFCLNKKCDLRDRCARNKKATDSNLSWFQLFEQNLMGDCDFFVEKN